MKTDTEEFSIINNRVGKNRLYSPGGKMKRILLSLCLLLVSAPAFAEPQMYKRHHHHHQMQRHWHSNHGWVWIAPTIIGGVVGYEIARNQQPIIVQQQQPVVLQTVGCDEWKEIRHSDGKITIERICHQR